MLNFSVDIVTHYGHMYAICKCSINVIAIVINCGLHERFGGGGSTRTRPRLLDVKINNGRTDCK